MLPMLDSTFLIGLTATPTVTGIYNINMHNDNLLNFAPVGVGRVF